MTILAVEANSNTQALTHDRLLYTQFFGFNTVPFSLTPDPDYFYNHASTQEAINKLLFATRTGEGFVKVTGEVGSGKTLLCRKFLSMIESHYVTAYIPNPYMSPLSLLLAIADELNIPYDDSPTLHGLLKAFTHFLIETYRTEKKTVVICMDEAHALPRPSLEVLRLLSNLETPKRKLLQLVLFGQPELNTHLSQHTIRQLKQRISFSAHLSPLSTAETEDYITHRLTIAGYQGARIFSAAALRTIARASQGIPRLI
ncbi:MAG: AAA family ATPase, partial [Gammaproteobacteria bacterium]|nr:AAA family ATPase [Gammaproteobacteria bacterium]